MLQLACIYKQSLKNDRGQKWFKISDAPKHHRYFMALTIYHLSIWIKLKVWNILTCRMANLLIVSPSQELQNCNLSRTQIHHEIQRKFFGLQELRHESKQPLCHPNMTLFLAECYFLLQCILYKCIFAFKRDRNCKISRILRSYMTLMPTDSQLVWCLKTV